jgi:5-methylcytosine-specific restriction endonuclease McrA
MRKHFNSTAKNNTNAKKTIIKQWEQKSGRKWPVRKGRSATLHHIIPLESGGANKWWNVMPTFGKAPNHSLKRVPGPHARGGILRKTIQAPRKKMLQKGDKGKVSGKYKEWDLRTPYKKH